MRIATEIGWGHKKGGARRVAINTLLAMARLRPDNEYIVYSNTFHGQFSGTIVSQHTMPSPGFVPQTLWDQFIFPHLAVPRAARGFKADVIHYTNNIVSCFEKDIPIVVSIYDMTPFVLPDTFEGYHAAYMRYYFRLAARRAEKIITISENSKKDICDILKVKEDKVSVVTLAADLGRDARYRDDEKSGLLAGLGVGSPFILYAGAIHPRKNIGRLIEAFSALKVSLRIPHKLVIAGARGWMLDKSVPAGTLEKLKDEVVLTGTVSDKELCALYGACDVFVYPSLYEGFGLPVLEAMSFGAPVVTSRISSLPEAAGGAAILVDPYDIESIAAGIGDIINKPAFADELRRKGRERAALCTWERTARDVLGVLESVA